MGEVIKIHLTENMFPNKEHSLRFLDLHKPVKDTQQQPPRGVLRKRCSENMQLIYRKSPMPKCDFNIVATATLLKSHFGMGVSCKFAACFQNIVFSKNTPWWLLLDTLRNSSTLFHGHHIEKPEYVYSWTPPIVMGFLTHEWKIQHIVWLVG